MCRTDAATNHYCHVAATMRIQPARRREQHAAVCAHFSEVGLLPLALVFPLSLVLCGAIEEGGESFVTGGNVNPAPVSSQDLKKAFHAALGLMSMTLHAKFTTGHVWSVEFTTIKKSTLLWAMGHYTDPSGEVSEPQALSRPTSKG